MINFSDIHINKKEYNYFWYINLFLQILYIALILGIAFVNINYVHYLIVSVHIFICLVLMLKFNRFIKKEVTVNKYEIKFIFTASTILLVNILIYEFGIFFNIENIKTYIDKYKQNFNGLL